MNIQYKSHLKYSIISSELSKLRQKLGQLIKEKSACMKIIFNNLSLIKGGIYIHNRKCGNSGCKCASTDYRHASYYLYKSDQGKNITTYLKSEEVGKVKKLTRNYIKFRQARATLIKNEKEIMNVINKIEKIRTIPFIREGKSEKKPIQKKGKKKKG